MAALCLERYSASTILCHAVKASITSTLAQRCQATCASATLCLSSLSREHVPKRRKSKPSALAAVLSCNTLEASLDSTTHQKIFDGEFFLSAPCPHEASLATRKSFLRAILATRKDARITSRPPPFEQLALLRTNCFSGHSGAMQ